MSQQTQFKCVLCGQDADLLGKSSYGKYSAVDCKKCGQFAVSDNASARIAGLPSQFADQWRQIIASAKPDEILLIIVEPVGSGGGLKAELVARSSLRL